jgi:putative ABC transport system substrate-binding protein
MIMWWSTVGIMVALTLSFLTAPRAVEAQPAHMPRIGVLTVEGRPAASPERFQAEFREALRERGYVEGQHVLIDYRWVTADQTERLNDLAVEFVRLPVDLLVASPTPAAQAAKRATATIPIVFNAGDPVGTGLVESLARPGGTMTGISDVSAELTPKRMELLKLMVPGLKRLAMLWNAGDLGMTLRYRASDAGAKAMGIAVQPLGIREPDDFEGAFKAMDAQRPDAILMVTDSLTNLNRKRVFDYAAAKRLPAMYEFDFLVRDGGLMSYGPDADESLGRVASLVDRILKGARPADLPFEQPTRFKLVISRKVARAIEVAIPDELLALADEVIE